MSETDRGFSALAEEERNDLIRTGIALKAVQAAEAAVKAAIMLVFHASDDITVQTLEAEDDALRKNTLGKLFRRLRERADIHPAAEALFREFLTTRNEFIHSLSEVERAHGKSGARALTNRAMSQGHAVSRFMSEIVLFWAHRLEEHVDGLRFPWERMRLSDENETEESFAHVPYFIRPKSDR